jgi:pyridoxamine 5'-phosphate oxidase
MAPWRSPLAGAMYRNRAVPFSRYFQLATVRADGTPANRSVVFRGFLAESDQLMIVSDRRSEKIAQIAQNPATEACWYFTKTREQFRLAGQLSVVTADTPQQDLSDARRNLWQTISASARAQFSWPQPKAPRADDAAFDQTDLNQAASEPAPSPAFCLLLLSVESVDHLVLRGETQSRHLYQKVAQQWQVMAVNP